MIKFLLMSLLSLSTAAKAASIKPDLSRTVHIVGVIGQATAKVPEKILSLATASKQPIYLMINSPGGSIVTGYIIVDAIGIARARGIEVSCMVGTLAASMAFNLLPYCSKVYVFQNSLLLFHPVRTGFDGAITPLIAENMAEGLRIIDKKIQAELMAFMNIQTVADQLWFQHHYIEETLWSALSLQMELKNVVLYSFIDDIQGINPFSFGRDEKEVSNFIKSVLGFELNNFKH